MPVTVLGKVSITPKGDYDENEEYNFLDVVYSPEKKSAYIAKKFSSKIPLTNEEHWMLLITGPKGDAGTIEIGVVETGDPGTDVEIENVGTPEESILNIKIPRGDKGSPLKISGSFDTINELNTAYPSGDADNSYLVDGTIHAWDGTQWKPISGFDLSNYYNKQQTNTLLLSKADLINGFVSESQLSLTKSQVGLEKVDNTSDVDKPVSTAQADAIGLVQSNVDTVQSNVDTVQTGLNSHIENLHLHISELVHTKVETVHELTGAVPDAGIFTARFKAVSDFVESDTFTVNGVAYVAHTASMEALPDGAFKAGAVVSADVDDDTKSMSFKIGEGGSKSIIVNATLLADGWIGDIPPYTQQVAINGVTEDSAQIIEVGMREPNVTEYRVAVRNAAIFPIQQLNGAVVIAADSDKPRIDLPIYVIIS